MPNQATLAGHDFVVGREQFEGLDKDVVLAASQEKTGILGSDVEEDAFCKTRCGVSGIPCVS